MAKHENAGSSPHTRGAHLEVIVDPVQLGIIPAYAGSTICRKRLIFSKADHPRIRGEHSRAVRSCALGAGSSPHTRGAHLVGRPPSQNHRIIPAYAGSTAARRRARRRAPDHPRIRGEHGASRGDPGTCGGSSPHTRGAPDHAECSLHCPRIIPAYAGSTGGAGVRRAWPRDHPRIRGEHRYRLAAGGDDGGSSPHTRGAPLLTRRSWSVGRIIPAYAGSTCPMSPTRRLSGDHPRIRGEHLGGGAVMRIEGGSSPHTRGAPPGYQAIAVVFRIIPAYAGSTCTSTRRFPALTDHPRIRGEHPPRRFAGRRRRGSSPHTRGARGDGLRGIAEHGIIPAYAGSTRPSIPSPPTRRDHPRIRGEHFQFGGGVVVAGGSSPHTRGARAPTGHPPAPGRIIPAYAGSTLGNPCNTKDRRRDYTSFPLPVTHPSGGGGS